MLNKKNLSSKMAIFCLVILLIFLGNLKYKQWKNQKAIEKEKSSLQAQADEFLKQNDDLDQSLQYLNSADFREKVARQQLNLKKEGEVAFSFTDASSTAYPISQNSKDSNFKKWWDYFFSN